MNMKWGLFVLAFSLSLPSLPSTSSYEVFNGTWQGRGRYKGYDLLKEKCNPMTLKIKITNDNAHLDYHFLCESFEFTDTINLERMNQTNMFYQNSSKAGSITHDQKAQKFLFSLKNIKFVYFGGPLNVKIRLNASTSVIDYTDTLTYSNGNTDSFNVILKKQ